MLHIEKSQMLGKINIVVFQLCRSGYVNHEMIVKST